MPKTKKVKVTTQLWINAVGICCDNYNNNGLTPSERDKFLVALENLNDVFTGIAYRENNSRIMLARLEGKRDAANKV